MSDVAAAVDELRQRLSRYPVGRYPVQHATTQFHLGSALLAAGSVSESIEALVAATQTFDPRGLPLEHAKSLMMLGVALREDDDFAAAAASFRNAAEAFATHDAPDEAAAARFNLGLVERDHGDVDAAVGCFRSALRRFDEAGYIGQAAAAARELGTTLFRAGDLDTAAEVLRDAVKRGTATGDQAGLGAAANVLGLVHLAVDEAAAASASFRDACGAHPRSVRPAEHAMAQANLALAEERLGRYPAARVAARQALSLPDAADPVVEQAQELLDRIPGDDETGVDDVLVVLVDAAPQRWVGIVRSETLRWAELSDAQRRAAAAAWISGAGRRRDAADPLAVALVGAIMELPPAVYDDVLRALVAAVVDADRADADRFKRAITVGMTALAVPQWLRLKDKLNEIAVELGTEPTWG